MSGGGGLPPHLKHEQNYTATGVVLVLASP
jgi:hypothetical protein